MAYLPDKAGQKWLLIIVLTVAVTLSAIIVYRSWLDTRPYDAAAELAQRKTDFEEAVEKGRLKLHPAEHWQDVDANER